MTDIHPEVQAALDMARELRNAIDDMRERVDAIRARRPSPSGLVIPEVDAMGRLTDLYLAPGTVARFSGPELVAEVMAAIRESTDDAARNRQIVMDNIELPKATPRSIDDVDGPRAATDAGSAGENSAGENTAGSSGAENDAAEAIP